MEMNLSETAFIIPRDGDFVSGFIHILSEWAGKNTVNALRALLRSEMVYADSGSFTLRSCHTGSFESII